MSAIHKTKGERTAERILDAAEGAFARRGFEGASLREIAAGAGIREPGLYNYFSNKQELYEAVLDRALAPMARVMRSQLDSGEGVRAYTDLPAVMTDLLLEHPAMSSLFQQALSGGVDSAGNELLMEWLQRLFAMGMETMREVGMKEIDEASLAIETIAMFNVCTGYLRAQPVFEHLVGGDLAAAENVERQKRLLARIQRALLLS